MEYTLKHRCVEAHLGELLEFVGAPRQEDCTRCESRRSGDGEVSFLVITYSLLKQGSYTLVWVLQRGLGGSVNSSIPREKIWLSCVPYFYFKQLNPFVVILAFELVD